jgi:hypothetical protein
MKIRINSDYPDFYPVFIYAKIFCRVPVIVFGCKRVDFMELEYFHPIQKGDNER